MKRKRIREEDLVLLDEQYSVTWIKTSDFICGQLIFLKSNPESPKTVIEVDTDRVVVTWLDKRGNPQYYGFKPECILQYEYAALVTIRRKFDICLN